MKSKILAISAICLATLSLMTAHANPILPEITFALENNPQLLSSRHALSSAQTRAQAAEASRLPTVNFSYDNGREKINSLPFGNCWVLPILLVYMPVIVFRLLYVAGA